jgi:hypothetical protein
MDWLQRGLKYTEHKPFGRRMSFAFRTYKWKHESVPVHRKKAYRLSRPQPECTLGGKREIIPPWESLVLLLKTQFHQSARVLLRLEGVSAMWYNCLLLEGASWPRLTSLYTVWTLIYGITMTQSERRKTERGRGSPGLALLAGAHTDIWLEREDLGMSLLLCPGKM